MIYLKLDTNLYKKLIEIPSDINDACFIKICNKSDIEWYEKIKYKRKYNHWQYIRKEYISRSEYLAIEREIKINELLTIL